MNILTRIGIALGQWLLRACGQEHSVGRAPSSANLATHLKLSRDRFGRFRPLNAPPLTPGTPPPWRDREGASPSCAGPGATQWSPEQILENAGVTPRMQKAATVPLDLPTDVHEKAFFERRLREYVAFNMDGWITGRSCSVGMAFAALMNTYAIDRRRVQLRLDELRLARLERAVSDAQLAQQTGVPVRNGRPVRTEVKGNTWIAYPPAGPPSASVDTRVGAGPAPARSDFDPRKPLPGSPADFVHSFDSSLASTPAPPTAWQDFAQPELSTPEGFAQSRTHASQRAGALPLINPENTSGAAARAQMQVQSTCDPAIRADAEAMYPAESGVGAERSLGPLSTENVAVAYSPQRREAALPPYEHVAETRVGAGLVPARNAFDNSVGMREACPVPAGRTDEGLMSGSASGAARRMFPAEQRLTPRAGDLGESPQFREPVTIPKYNPHFDVVAGLSTKLKQTPCENGYCQGFGNDTRQAIESYYAKNQSRFKSQWAMFGVGCKVFEDFDSKGRKYYVASASAGVDRQGQEAELGGYGDGSQRGPPTDETWQATGELR